VRTWRHKAEEIIAAMCMASYRQANYRNGRKLAKHVPYSVPAAAQALVECLERDDEHAAKSLMAYDYDIEKIRDVERI
jgi:hypothetical protein